MSEYTSIGKALYAEPKHTIDLRPMIDEAIERINFAIDDHIRTKLIALGWRPPDKGDGEARVSEDARDARRYRWLKSQSVSRRGEERPILVTPVAFHQNDWDGQIDRYIDAALGVADQGVT